MKISVQNYLLKLLHAGIDLDFSSVVCRYGKFTMYCLIGPEENIFQVTFAPKKHQRLLEQLQSLNPAVHFKTVSQREFIFDSMFAGYFSGSLTSFQIKTGDLPLVAAGSDFQQRVWEHMRAIPYGCTMTYGRLAQLAGSPGGARAVGMACRANPLSLIIPCHRVVAENGLGGFAGGVTVKKNLLELEQGKGRKLH